MRICNFKGPYWEDYADRDAVIGIFLLEGSVCAWLIAWAHHFSLYIPVVLSVIYLLYVIAIPLLIRFRKNGNLDWIIWWRKVSKMWYLEDMLWLAIFLPGIIFVFLVSHLLRRILII